MSDGFVVSSLVFISRRSRISVRHFPVLFITSLDLNTPTGQISQFVSVISHITVINIGRHSDFDAVIRIFNTVGTFFKEMLNQGHLTIVNFQDDGLLQHAPDNTDMVGGLRNGITICTNETARAQLRTAEVAGGDGNDVF